MAAEYTLILLKPDAYRRKLVKTILKTCAEAGLKIVYKKTMYLTEEMMRTYQPVLNLPGQDGTTDWQYLFINAYTQIPTDVFLMKGKDAITKTNRIKKELREKYVKGNATYTPYNLLHSTNSYEDLLVNVKVLIPEKWDLVQKKKNFFWKKWLKKLD